MASTSNNDAGVLRARIEDTFRLCAKRQSPCFYGFLDAREQALVRQWLSRSENWLLQGGYPDAERQVLAVIPDYLMPEEIVFPFCAVAFHYRSTRQLSHRDVLGTLLSAGLRRDKIGDILCGEGISVVYLWDELVDFVCEQITKVGGEGIKVTPHYDGELPLTKQYLALNETVASPRLDCLVKALLHCSREESAQLIRIGNVSVNHIPLQEVSRSIEAPCTVSIKGSGRFLIDQLGPPTKKGRLALTARKCI